MRSSTSLQTRLIGLLLVLVAIFFTASFLLADLRADRVGRRDTDDRLRVTASLIVRIQEASDPNGRPASVLAADPGRGGPGETIFPAFEVRTSRGEIVLRSTDFPAAIALSGAGYANGVADELEWRLLTVEDPDRGLTYRVGINSVDEARLARNVRGDILTPLVTLLPILAIAMLLTVWVGLRPLRRIERAVGTIEPDRLRHVDLGSSRMPRELSRFTAVLNGLLERLQLMVRHQRAFVMAAGHELRTPLAGCLTQLEVALRSTDPQRRSASLEKLGDGLHRMERLVGQLLTLARSERSSLNVDASSLRVDVMVEAIAAEKKAEGGEVLVIADHGPLSMRGNSVLIDAMIRNLVDNALRMSPIGEDVEICLREDRESLVIEVCDRGPGLSDEDKARVFESFYQVDRAATEGTGLGLAIVKAVADAHRGRVEVIDREPRGLCMRVVLPRAVA